MPSREQTHDLMTNHMIAYINHVVFLPDTTRGLSIFRLKRFHRGLEDSLSIFPKKEKSFNDRCFCDRVISILCAFVIGMRLRLSSPDVSCFSMERSHAQQEFCYTCCIISNPFQVPNDGGHGGEKANISSYKRLLKRQDSKRLLFNLSTKSINVFIRSNNKFTECWIVVLDRLKRLVEYLIDQASKGNDLGRNVLQVRI